MVRSHLLLLLVHCVLLLTKSNGLDDVQSPKRQVWAWAATTRDSSAAAAQLRNNTWNSIINGIQAFCGLTFSPDGTGFILNQTEWNACSDIRKAASDNGVQFHVWIQGRVPDQVSATPFVKAAIDLAAKHENVCGFSLDDESDCAPRGTLAQFQRWMTWVNDFSRGLGNEGLKLSAAVQALFGIQDVPYQNVSQPCQKHPRDYPLEPRVGDLLSTSNLDRWLIMDTYYFTTGRFLDALQWHLQNVPLEELGIAMMNRNDLTRDGLQARFYAIDQSQVDWINIFLLPIDDEFLPYLQRWKSKCAGCGAQPVLGCYDMDVPCDDKKLVDVTEN